MKVQPIGKTALISTRIAYGGWRIAGAETPEGVTPASFDAGRRAVIAAYEAGYTLFDHADIYCRGVCESIQGQAMRDVPGMRDKILIATKCGIRFAGDPRPDSPHRYDFSREHIVRSCEGSLRRLGIETIDLYQLHRPDLLMSPEEVAAAFDHLKQQGKVREFGVSNFAPSFVTVLQGACSFQICVNQVEVHLGRLDCLHDGTLDQCLSSHRTPLAWSPLGGGMLGSGASVPADHPRFPVLSKLVHTMDEIARSYGIDRTTLALAWLLKHPSRIIPIVGSARPESDSGRHQGRRYRPFARGLVSAAGGGPGREAPLSRRERGPEMPLASQGTHRIFQHSPLEAAPPDQTVVRRTMHRGTEPGLL